MCHLLLCIRPGKKNIEIRTPQRGKVAATISYYQGQHGRPSKQPWMEVKEELVKAGVLCSLICIKKVRAVGCPAEGGRLHGRHLGTPSRPPCYAFLV